VADDVVPAGGLAVKRTPEAGQAHRIVLTPDEIRGQDVVLSAANTHHVREVLRLRHGALVRGLVPDGPIPGYDLVLRVGEMWEHRQQLSVVERIELVAEPQLAIEVCQGLSRGERFEITLQKCTEIGAMSFVPLLTERTVLRPDVRQREQRMQRWRRIIEEAALQSGRTRIPTLAEPIKLAELVTLAAAAPVDLSLIAYEAEHNPFRAFVQARRNNGELPRTARIVIGPEGGLARAEVDCLSVAGFTPVSLGPRILRTETAGPVMTALLLYEFADLGGLSGG